MTNNNKRKQKHQLFNTILADTNLSDGAVRVAGALLFLFHNTKSGLCFPSNARWVLRSGWLQGQSSGM